MKYDVDDLINKKLVKFRWNDSGIGSPMLRIFKYDRSVFFKNLWGLDKRLILARGIVTGIDDTVLLYPFDKIFNLGENNTGEGINPREVFRVVEKRNGFLAQVRVLKDQVIVTSSGSFTGPYKAMAQEMIFEALSKSDGMLSSDYTYMFEICHPNDPHIVHEDTGAYLIGMRDMVNAPHRLLPEFDLDAAAIRLGFKRPAHWVATMREIVEFRATSKIEGLVVRNLSDETPVFKVKTYHYLCKKALMRMGNSSLDAMYSDTENFKSQRLEEEFYSVCDWIVDNFTIDQWKNLSEQDRRHKMEKYFEQNF